MYRQVSRLLKVDGFPYGPKRLNGSLRSRTLAILLSAEAPEEILTLSESNKDLSTRHSGGRLDN